MAATSFSFRLVADGDLSCLICFNLLKDPNTPKQLDCSHICCAPCIQKMMKGGRRVVECPGCRHATNIPEDGVEAMKTAHRLQSLAVKYYEHGQKNDSALTNDNNSLQEWVPKETSDPVCPTHNLAVDLYCKKCNFAGCSSCMWFSHKDSKHKVCDIATVYREQKEQMVTTLNQLIADIEKYEQSVKELNDLEKNMRQFSMQQKEDLVKHSEFIIAAVKESVLQVQKNYDTVEQPKIDRVCNEKLRLQKQVTKRKEMKSSVQLTMDTCAVHEYVEQHTAISRSVVSELEKDSQVPKDLYPVVGKTRLGMVRARACNINVGTLLKVKICELKQIQEFGVSRFARSLYVSETSDGLLVVRFDNATLKIYRRNEDGEYKRESEITLSSKNQTRRQCGIGVSVNGKYLVVMGTVIEIYSPSGQYEGILKFKPTPDGKGEGICKEMKPWYLQVDDHCLLVADNINRTISRFTHDGMFLQIVPTTFLPGRIALMPNGKVAATNGRVNKLFIVDMISGREILTVEIPQAHTVCYHEESDTLLVGRCLKRKNQATLDTSTGVIEQYCRATGAFIRRVYRGDSGEVFNPRGMMVTKDGTLVVACVFSVKAFSISILE